MNKIIKWCKQIVAIRKTPQRNLTLEEQISLIKSCKYRKIVAVSKKQSFHDDVVIELLHWSLCEGDKYYKFVISYYRRYGFTSKVKSYILENMKSRGLVNFMNFFINDFQITYKKSQSIDVNNYLELFNCGDDGIIDFFRKVKPLLAYLDKIEQIEIQNQQLEDLFSEMDVQGTYILDSEPIRRDGYVYQNQSVCKYEVMKYYPDFGIILKIIASGNEIWISTLVSVIKRTNTVWKNVFGIEYKVLPDVLKNYLKNKAL